MSPHRSLSTRTSRKNDQDVVMHSTDDPLPSPANVTDKELVEKYRTLKRRYHELEQSHDETSTGLERSEERNVRRREERSRLLDSITLFEKEHPGIQNLSAIGPSSLQSISASILQNSVDEHGRGAESNEQTAGGNESSSAKGTRTSRNGTQRNRGLLQAYYALLHQWLHLYSLKLILAEFIASGNSSHPSPSNHSLSTSENSHDIGQSASTNDSILSSNSSVALNDQHDQSGKKHLGGETNANTSRAPVSGPSRSTRRSSRLVAVEREPLGEGIEPGPGRRTRGAAKRMVASPVGKPQSSTAFVTTVGKTRQAKVAASSDSALPVQTRSSSTNLPTHTPTPNSPASDEILPSDPNIDPSLTSSTNVTSVTKEFSPMENIVKVAEAAIAAQNAANSRTSATTQSMSPSDPTPSTSTASSSSQPASTSSNPYMALVPGKLNTSVMPLSMNPYAVYYAPGTPVASGASPYSPYGNPYYYLTTPTGGPSGAFPPSPIQSNIERPSPDPQRPAKPKRLKAHTVTSKSFSIPMVPRDKRGNPMLPLNVGIMTVISLGEVCMREHFHTERYIFPVGYEVTRRYLSTVDPNIEVVYHCTILDGGDGPKFQIVPSDVPGRPVIAGTATGAWSSIVKQANAIRNRQHSNSVSGPDFFGLGQNTIKHLIQELPNADRLRDYVWQTFIEGGPLGGRHAAVIPALPEEYETSLPIGAYYPTQSEREKRIREAGGVPEPSRDISGGSYYPRHVHLQAERLKQHSAQPGEPSSSQTAPHTPSPPQIDTNLIDMQDIRPQLATSADRTQASDGPGTGVATRSSTTAHPMAATIASIMSAFPPAATPTPTSTQ
ncbi:hypothetical protein C0993_005747 [Termitomyces sp. T159_Od127]|nr:hypothetical protein C0993_005747 [Termitomyces sp. T159_Od127]